MCENEERWKQLCELAAKEQNPKKLIELTREINELLSSKRKRLEQTEANRNNKLLQNSLYLKLPPSPLQSCATFKE